MELNCNVHKQWSVFIFLSNWHTRSLSFCLTGPCTHTRMTVTIWHWQHQEVSLCFSIRKFYLPFICIQQSKSIHPSKNVMSPKCDILLLFWLPVVTLTSCVELIVICCCRCATVTLMSSFGGKMPCSLSPSCYWAIRAEFNISPLNDALHDH